MKSKIQESITTKIIQETYRQLGEDINKGKLLSLNDVYSYVTKTQLATDMNLNPAGFIRLKAINASVWRVDDIIRFAEVTGADGEKIYSLLAKSPTLEPGNETSDK